MARGRAPQVSHVVVETDDDDAATPGKAPREPEPVDPAARARSRRRWAVAGTVVLALVAGATVADHWGTRRRTLDLADVPGVLAPMTSAPTTLWELADARLLGATDDLVVVSAADGVLGVEPASGEARWTLDLGGRHARWCSTVPTETVTVLPGITPATADPEGLAVCEVVARAGMVGAAGPLSQAPVVTSLLTAVDLASGIAVRQVGLPGPVVATAAHEGDLVVAVQDITGRLQVLRWDAGTGAERWRWVDDDAVVDPSAGLTVGIGPEVIRFQGRAVGRFGEPGGVTLDLATGTATSGASGVGRDVAVARLADGTVVRVVLPWGDGTAHARITLPGGERRIVRDRLVLLPAVDADPTHRVLVTLGARGSGLRGVDRTDGRAVWWVPDVTVDAPPVQVDGAVVVPGAEGRVVGVDLRSGALLWQRDVGDVLPSGGLTDGALVLVSVRGGGTGDPGDTEHTEESAELVALGARDGLPRWRLALPAGADRVDAAAGALVVSTDGGLVALGQR